MYSFAFVLKFISTYLFRTKKSFFLWTLSLKIYRWSLPRKFKHIAITGPDFALSNENNFEQGKTIIWRKQNIAKTRPLKEIINTQQGSCFIIGSGPSINEFDFSALKNKTLFGVNGSINILKPYNLKPDYYAITDPDFFEHRIDLVRDIILSKTTCFFSYSGISRICDYSPELLHSSEIYLTEIINRHFSFPRLEQSAFFKKAQSNPNIILPSVSRNDDNIVGFSKDISDGIFCSRTILYRAIQIAYSIGYRRIYLLGMDLGYQDKPRFYSEGISSRPSKLEKDYTPYILPSFKVVSELMRMHEIEIYNVSDKSRLPANIIPRISFQDAIEEKTPNHYFAKNINRQQ